MQKNLFLLKLKQSSNFRLIGATFGSSVKGLNFGFSFVAELPTSFLKICGFAISGLAHLRNLRIWDLRINHIKICGFLWLADLYKVHIRNLKICNCGVSPRICRLELCRPIKKTCLHTFSDLSNCLTTLPLSLFGFSFSYLLLCCPPPPLPPPLMPEFQGRALVLFPFWIFGHILDPLVTATANPAPGNRQPNTGSRQI